MAEITTGTVNQLPPLAPQVDMSNPLIPEWVPELVKRVDLLTQLSINGAPAAIFSDANAVLKLGATGRLTLAAVTSGGTLGYVDILNGVIVGITPAA